MGKVFKGITTLGVLGGAAYGLYKMKKKIDYINEVYNDVVMFNGERIVYDDVFEGDSIAAVCAGLEIDMSEMIMETDMVNLDIIGYCSGIKVVVPEGIHVVTSGSTKASGANINVAQYENEDILTLNINYDLNCSGLEIVTKYDEEEPDEDEEEVEEMTSDEESEEESQPEAEEEASEETTQEDME